MVKRALNIYKCFATQLDLKIDGGAAWTEIPPITLAHKNLGTIWRNKILEVASNDSKRNPLFAPESREVKLK